MEWITSRKKSGKSLDSGKYVRLYNKANGKEAIVRVTFDAKVTHCLMDSRIVHRLGFETLRNPTTGCNPMPSRLTGDHIDLICDRGPVAICDNYRFYVDTYCRFDILIGSSASYLSLPAL